MYIICLLGAHGGPKRASDPLSYSYRQLKVTVWVLGNKQGSCANALTC